MHVSVHHWAIRCRYWMIWARAIHIETCYTDLSKELLKSHIILCVRWNYYNIVKQNTSRINNQSTARNVPLLKVGCNCKLVCLFVCVCLLKPHRCEQLTAIKLLLTEPRPFSALLKCSMTSQLDFFGVVVAVALVSELITGECNDGTCNSSEICGVRVCRNDVERRPIPLREFTSFSFFFGYFRTNEFCWNHKKNKYVHKNHENACFSFVRMLFCRTEF